MRRDTGFSVIAAMTILLASSSCSAPVRVSGARTFGRTQDISAADVQTAVAAYQASVWHGPARYGDIDVISQDEIRIYQEHAPSNYTSMVRVKGKWEIGSVVLMHPAY
jgi:hypothetical protein